MTDEELKRRGWSIPIWRAIEAAGGPVNVAYKLGIPNSNSVVQWAKRGIMRLGRANDLCALGGNKVTLEQLIAEIAENERKRMQESRAAA